MAGKAEPRYVYKLHFKKHGGLWRQKSTTKAALDGVYHAAFIISVAKFAQDGRVLCTPISSGLELQRQT